MLKDDFWLTPNLMNQAICFLYTSALNWAQLGEKKRILYWGFYCKCWLLNLKRCWTLSNNSTIVFYIVWFSSFWRGFFIICYSLKSLPCYCLVTTDVNALFILHWQETISVIEADHIPLSKSVGPASFPHVVLFQWRKCHSPFTG